MPVTVRVDDWTHPEPRACAGCLGPLEPGDAPRVWRTYTDARSGARTMHVFHDARCAARLDDAEAAATLARLRLNEDWVAAKAALGVPREQLESADELAALLAYPECSDLVVEAVATGMVARLPLEDARLLPVRAAFWTRAQCAGWFQYVHALRLRGEADTETLRRVVDTAAAAHPRARLDAWAHDDARLVLYMRLADDEVDEAHAFWACTFLDKDALVPEAATLAQALLDDDDAPAAGLRGAWIARSLLAWRQRRAECNELFARVLGAVTESLALHGVEHETVADLSVNRATPEENGALVYRVNAQQAGEPERLYYLIARDGGALGAWTRAAADRRAHAPVLHDRDVATEMTQRGFRPAALPGLAPLRRG